jgi:MFS transporter, MHS family, proline/betaine transporter
MAGRWQPCAAPPPPASIVTVAAIGTAFEIYDFTLFAFVSPILAPTFFPALSRDSSLLLTAATFGIAAIVRPIGALFFGLYGDRVRRKPVLIPTLTLMGKRCTVLSIT